MVWDGLTEAVKHELRAARRERVSRVSLLANYDLLRYLRVYNLLQNCALLPTRLFYSEGGEFPLLPCISAKWTNCCVPHDQSWRNRYNFTAILRYFIEKKVFSVTKVPLPGN